MSTSIRWKIPLFISILLLQIGCNAYKPTQGNSNNFVVGQKYEIRIGDRPMERVIVNDVTDSTLVVRKGRTEVIVQRDMITEIKHRKVSTGNTVFGVVVGGLLALVLVGTLSWL
ncbi:hypothetical protein J0X14_05210 [Muricauda sp. CAU 1633]|uniref:hypothetical protein n=1 Tax=Allomuricauda sp. CAU 1633 TaxID=2816036 RepID=UPI001A8EFF92|nr:hypothetical protein [Muricauda sp. CAU 1633]MBO0321684.1 hypothetical protein [Muricauda sp. CAU 1633]